MLDEKVNFESVTLIWLDQMGNSTQANREIQEKFRSIVNYLQTFETCDECEGYLRSFTADDIHQVLLIVSGRFAEEILRRVADLNQVQFIFIFCMDEQKYQSTMKTYPKVVSLSFFPRLNYLSLGSRGSRSSLRSVANSRFAREILERENPSVEFDLCRSSEDLRSAVGNPLDTDGSS